MPQVTSRAEFPVDRRHAFDYLTDPRNWPSFYSNLTELTGDTPPAFAKRGDTVTFHYSLLGRTLTATAVLEDVVYGERVRTRISTPGLPDVQQDWRYCDSQTGFVIEVTLNTVGATAFLGKIIDRYVIPRALQRDVDRTLENMASMFSIGIPEREQTTRH